MVKLGDQVQDRISGFKGTVTGIAEYLYGCRQCHVVAKSLDGVSLKGEWLDEQRLDAASTNKKGGPQSTPPERSTPRRA